MKNNVCLLLLSSVLCFYFGNAQSLGEKSDVGFTKTYEKFVANEYDYEGRDSILMRFKQELSIALNDRRLNNYFFPKWDEQEAITVSKDSLLTILSWDWENNGTWHVYESMYRLVKGTSVYTGFLYENDAGYEESLATVYYKIDILPDASYLVKGWGTHGAGKEFFIFRKLSLKNGKLQDCDACFDGEDTFFFEISRGENDLKPKYDIISNEISFHELAESYIDGDPNEPSGFMRATGKILTLKYKNGMFIPADQ